MRRGNKWWAWVVATTLGAGAAQQSSESYRVVADVFCDANPAPAVSSTRMQSSLSVEQRAVVGKVGSSRGIGVELGYQATTEGFDTDRDGVPDWKDDDADGDGVLNVLDPRPYDTDNDGLNNLVMDDDDDEDGLTDQDEDLVTLTSPVDARDCLKVLGVRRAGAQMVVRWATKPGKEGYRLQRAVVLDHKTNWQTIAIMASTGVVTEATDSNAFPRAFYRITLPR